MVRGTCAPVEAPRTASHVFQPPGNETIDRKVPCGNDLGAGSYAAPHPAVAARDQAEQPVPRGIGPKDRRCRMFLTNRKEVAILGAVVGGETLTVRLRA